MPHFEHYGYPLPNNSYIYSRDVANDIGGALLCKNGDKKPLYGKWQYPNGGDIPRDDSSHCIYYRNTSQQISLHRMRSCPDYYTSVPAGLWRCVFANSSEDMQTLYIYIGNRRRSDSYYGKNIHVICISKPYFSAFKNLLLLMMCHCARSCSNLPSFYVPHLSLTTSNVVYIHWSLFKLQHNC